MKTCCSPRLALTSAILLGLAAACSPRPELTAADAPAPAADGAAPVEVAAVVETVALEIQPEALAALDKMGAYLRTLDSFEMNADITTEEVLDSGQKIQFGGKVTYKVRKPDGFYIEHDTDRKKRTFYYDGKTLTLWSPRMKLYAQTPAPPTIREVVAMADEKYDLRFPLADLFYWGTDHASTDEIVSAVNVGYAKVGDVDCQHFAFRQGDVDWQIFIQTGDKPLPRKIIITTLTDDARPQFTGTMSWKENPPFTSPVFVFTPPADAQRIKIEPTT